MGTHLTNCDTVFVVDDDLDEEVARHSWQCDKDGYIRRWNGKHHHECRLHRWVMNFPDGVVDHINGDITNNTRANLRVLTNQQNLWNNKVKGVSQLKGGKWMARIQANGKRITLGSNFRTREEAEAAYKKAWEKRLESLPL